MEQLPVDLKGGSYDSKCEHYGVSVFVVCMCVSSKPLEKLGFQPIWAF